MKTGIQKITKPLLIKYPTTHGDHIRIMFQQIAAIEPLNDKECKIHTSAGVFKIALSEEAVLEDLEGYTF